MGKPLVERIALARAERKKNPPPPAPAPLRFLRHSVAIMLVMALPSLWRSGSLEFLFGMYAGQLFIVFGVAIVVVVLALVFLTSWTRKNSTKLFAVCAWSIAAFLFIGPLVIPPMVENIIAKDEGSGKVLHPFADGYYAARAEALAKKSGFDIDGARKEGFTNEQIYEYLSTPESD